METVGVKELKNHLSRYLRGVKAGEEVLVSERGKVVARIIPAGEGVVSEAEALHGLQGRGLVQMPEIAAPEELPELLAIRGEPISETVLKDRR